MFETEALKSLGAFPLVQAALALLIVVGGVLALLRGNRDRVNGTNAHVVPQWIMMGPMHDAIAAVHQINERTAQNQDLLDRIEQNTRLTAESLRTIAETMKHNTAVLEMIRNESRLR